MRKKILVIIFLLGLSIALLGNPSPSAAGTIIVDGNCTLVDAIIAANTDAPSGQCPAGSGDDVISLTVDVQFTEAYPGSTNIGGGQAALPDITSNIVIEGNGYRVSGDFPSFGEVGFRFAYITSSATVEISTTELYEFIILQETGTVSGGLLYVDSGASVSLYGGTVYSTGAVISNLAGNASGGSIFNNGTLSIDNMYFGQTAAVIDDADGSATGGAIYSTGSTMIKDSTFWYNGAIGNSSVPTTGGVIFTTGPLTIESTLFDGNVISNGGGDSYGGVLTLEGATMVTNSTFYHNGVEFGTTGYGGAIAVNTSALITISHSTFVDNSSNGNLGEVIYVESGEPIVEGSIIASRGHIIDLAVFAPSPPDGPDCFGPMTGSGNLTIDGDTSCSAISSGTIELNTHVSTTLADHGGPTDTLALIDVVGNPAVNGNPNCGLLTDQRNYDRDTNCDIGAFELNGVPPTATPTPTLTPTMTFTPTDTPTETPTPIGLSVNAVCVDENLEVTITDGDGPFEISASGGGNLPVTVGIGTHTILGPDKWDDLTVTEQSGDGQSINLGTFRCRTDERPVPLMPAHRSRITNPFPTFSWTGISDANNYRVFVFDEADPGLRTVDIRQNSGGSTTIVLSTPLPIDRLFWRVRGRQNRVWSLWSIRFTLFVDPPTAQESVVTPVPTIHLDVATSTPVPTISVPDGGLTPAPTLIQPPNSR